VTAAPKHLAEIRFDGQVALVTGAGRGLGAPDCGAALLVLVS
jgi:hypothetical protein